MAGMSSEERLKRLKAFIRAARRIVKKLPPDRLYGMDGKVAEIRSWRERARKIIRNLYVDALFKFMGVCYVVLINKRLDCDIPIILLMLQLGELQEINSFTFEYKREGKVRVGCRHNRGNWVCELSIDISCVEKGQYLIKAFSTRDEALKWLNENIENG